MFIWIIFWFMLVMMVGTTPVWPHSRRWGYYPSSGLTFVLLIFLCVWMFGGLSGFGHQGWWGNAPVPAVNR
jgi:hypothetical protein